MQYPWHLYLMAAIYIFAGIMHFIKPKVYIAIMPNYLPNAKLLVLLSGISEVVLGITLCIPILKNVSIYGIIAMLAVFFVVHIHMLNDEKIAAKFPKWLLWSRIPLQFGLMYWAYYYLQF